MSDDKMKLAAEISQATEFIDTKMININQK